MVKSETSAVILLDVIQQVLGLGDLSHLLLQMDFIASKKYVQPGPEVRKEDTTKDATALRERTTGRDVGDARRRIEWM